MSTAVNLAESNTLGESTQVRVCYENLWHLYFYSSLSCHYLSLCSTVMCLSIPSTVPMVNHILSGLEGISRISDRSYPEMNYILETRIVGAGRSQTIIIVFHLMIVS
jgi:hypothetical protein